MFPNSEFLSIPQNKAEASGGTKTYIFDFDKELYGKTIMVEFLLKTRDEIKFDSLDELKAQIVKDCVSAREYHEGLK